MGRPASPLPRELIQQELRRSHGNVRAAARALGVSKQLLWEKIDEYHLSDVVKELRSFRTEIRRQELKRLIGRHRGDLSQIAKELNLPYHTVYSRLVRYSLHGAVSAAQQPKLAPPEERQLILSRLREHAGNIKEAAKDLGLSPTTTYDKVKEHGLRAESDALRAEAGIPGPRSTRKRSSTTSKKRIVTEPLIDREELLNALRDTSGDIVVTARGLGASDKIVRSRIREYGLSSALGDIRAAVESHREDEDRRTISRELHRHAGSVDEAARALNVSPRTLRRRLARLGLKKEAVAARAVNVRKEREDLVAVLKESRGNVDLTARKLGVSASTLRQRIERLNLQRRVDALRPKLPSAEDEVKQILTALKRNKGVITEAAKALGLARNTLIARVKKYNLSAEAIDLRGGFLRSGTKREQRRKLRELLESCDWSVVRAHSVAGVSIGTIYNMMKRLGLERPVETPQERLQRAIDALRLTGGVGIRAAEKLGISERTFREWCREFDLDPLAYRSTASSRAGER